MFSGCGGSSLGYKMAGGEVLLAVDNNAEAMKTYRLNFPTTPVFCDDIAKLSVKECCRRAGIKPRELDILDGSPPCDGFSPLGKRQFADPRNQLYTEFVRLLRGLQPRAFVFENVAGMVRAEMKLIFADCLESMKACRYRVKARLLDAQYFHVPHCRERVIIIGVREDLGILPSHPKGQGEPQSVREALGLLGEGSVKNDQFASQFRTIDLPCVTLAKHPPLLLLNGKQRKLSVEECAVLAGFPQDWKWDSSANRLIGNAVPPPFMRSIAEHIRDRILAVAADRKAKRCVT